MSNLHEKDGTAEEQTGDCKSYPCKDNEEKLAQCHSDQDKGKEDRNRGPHPHQDVLAHVFNTNMHEFPCKVLQQTAYLSPT